MRKLYLLASALILALGIVGCGTQQTASRGEIGNTDATENTAAALLYSVETIPAVGLNNISTTHADDIALVNLKPCVVYDGVAYMYDDGWKAVEAASIAHVYDGDTFCAIDDDGSIILKSENMGEYEGYPLGSAGIYHNAEQMLKLTENEKISKLGGSPVAEYCTAYFKDGSTRIFHNGYALELSDSIAVADISGRFVLAEDGTVYKASYDEEFTIGSLKAVSDKKYVSIAECTSADRCIGINEDGTVTVWSDVNMDMTFTADNARTAAIGFNYGAVVCDDGMVEFHSVKKDVEKQISEYLGNLDKKATAVTCNYDSIAILLEDGSIHLISMN